MALLETRDQRRLLRTSDQAELLPLLHILHAPAPDDAPSYSGTEYVRSLMMADVSSLPSRLELPPSEYEGIEVVEVSTVSPVKCSVQGFMHPQNKAYWSDWSSSYSCSAYPSSHEQEVVPSKLVVMCSKPLCIIWLADELTVDLVWRGSIENTGVQRKPYDEL